MIQGIGTRTVVIQGHTLFILRDPVQILSCPFNPLQWKVLGASPEADREMPVRGYLEAGGDGCELVVCRLWVANEVVPACEHFPAEIKTSVISTTIFICIPCHSAKVKKTQKGPIRSSFAM